MGHSIMVVRRSLEPKVKVRILVPQKINFPYNTIIVLIVLRSSVISVGILIAKLNKKREPKLHFKCLKVLSLELSSYLPSSHNHIPYYS